MEFLNRIKQLYAVDCFEGYTEKEINFLKQLFGSLPQVLEKYYRVAGRTNAFHHIQDNWMLPENFETWNWLQKSDYLILLNENQGVCRAGISRTDLFLPDPPVYTTQDDKPWVLSASSTTEFLEAALTYEAAFTFPYSPEEFYWLTEDEIKFIQARLIKNPVELRNWLGDMELTFYQNASDNLVVIMDCGQLQTLYGAASDASYQKLLSVMRGLGEVI